MKVTGERRHAMLNGSTLAIVPQNQNEAVRYFTLAADECDGKAKELYARSLSTGDFVPQDELESAQYWQLAADQMRGSRACIDRYHLGSSNQFLI